ncbi:MAG: DNA methyltransferase, partial [bacterium]|nr:DNA methyltransferase [bacterium]
MQPRTRELTEVGNGKIVFGDNLTVLQGLADASVDLIYIDPPFNTGKRQQREQIKTMRDEADGDRTGFASRRYRTIRLGKSGYEDAFDDYMGFLAPRFEEARRVLADTGSFFCHIDYREVHYCKV